MPSWSAVGVRFYIEYIRRTKATFANAAATAKEIEDLYVTPKLFAPQSTLGPGIVVKRIDIDDWPLYHVSHQGEKRDESREAMMYIHGGAFYHDIDGAHWSFIAQTARETGLDVIVPIYPLVPRPTATAQHVVAGMVTIARQSTQRVVGIAGDSAGGCIAMATTQKIALETDLAMRFLVVISPVLDLAVDHAEVVRLEKRDPWLGTEGMKVIGPHWAADLSMKDPLVSPLFGDIAHLPPVLILSGTADMLNGDAKRLNDRYQNGGDGSAFVAGSIEMEKFKYIEKEDMVHVYPLLPSWEGAQAREEICTFITKQLK
jgi:acetyl esterase/lipase